jgi:hypothetical protein
MTVSGLYVLSHSLRSLAFVLSKARTMAGSLSGPYVNWTFSRRWNYSLASSRVDVPNPL